ncbi:MAG: hypothetical protein K6A40_03830 [Solobacterium sp.]|nr:hypothetical protein [Solobacterium sp.]
MLELSEIYAVKNGKTILKDAAFCASEGSFTVILGKGSGKHAAAEALLLKQQAKYIADGMEISTLPEEEQARFLFEHVSAVMPDPVFDEERTVYENMQLLQDLYGCGNNGYQTAEDLGLSDCFDQYPSQLSREQKHLAALVNALIKEPDILVYYDRKLTAESRRMVYVLLKQYSMNHTVIVLTAGTLFSEDAGRVYEISEGLMRVKKDCGSDRIILKEKTEKKKINVNLFQERRKISVLPVIILSLAAVLSAVSVCITHLPAKNMEHRTESFQSLHYLNDDQLIVYRSVYDTLSYTSHGSELPLSAEERSLIEHTEGIRKISVRVDVSQWNDSEKYISISCAGQPSGDKQIIEQGPILQSVYADDDVYTDHVIRSYGEEGVFITADLARKLSPGTGSAEWKDPVLHFTLLVPMYDVRGMVTYYDQDSEYEGNWVYCRKTAVQLPIRGILQTTQYREDEYAVLVPLSVLEEEIRQGGALEMTEGYLDKETNEAVPGRPQDESAEIYQMVKWQPDAYKITCGKKDLPYIVSDLSRNGLACLSDQYDVSQILLPSRAAVKYLRITSCCVLAAVLLYEMILILKSMRKAGRYHRFLKELGLNRKERKAILHAPLYRNTAVSAGCSVILFFAGIKVLSLMHIANVHVSGAGLLILTGLPACVFLIFPACLLLLLWSE